jgi:hypothetical protein
MNERIKQLVGQAKFMAEENINKKISANAELNAFADQLAELIIVKCANIVWYEAEQADSAQINEVGYKILQHFGVE